MKKSVKRTVEWFALRAQADRMSAVQEELLTWVVLRAPRFIQPAA